MQFECPATLGDMDLYMKRPMQQNWNVNDVGPDSSKWDKTVWESHLSMRAKYQFPERQGIDLADAYLHRKFFEDVTTRTPDGAHMIAMGAVRAGALTFVPPQRQHTCDNTTRNGDFPPTEMIHRAQSTVHDRYVD